MTVAQSLVDYMREHDLRLTTAESCTAGLIVTLLAEVPGSGSLIESGYVVYSPEAKQRLLGVKPRTIDTFNLTSREVAEEMALGALHDANANVAVATTGLLGPDDKDGIPAGTICFAWAFQVNGQRALFSRQERFFGDRHQVQLQASEYVLQQLPRYHQRAVAGERR
ncbi:CinA family protein [Pseudomonas sp. SWRI102]|uniref:CinA family protein n=1 Tax=Pseudomonas marvdashtae TaxID=2745500 RepID=A0A923FKU1_9PSED|nr:CinA family protein [Pseudomonas marvdashtae]MBV4552055.1 CinA family protein [Pseudomonas marvdashtae]